MPQITIEVSTEDATYLIKKTKQKGYTEKAGEIFTKAKIVEWKTMDGESGVSI